MVDVSCCDTWIAAVDSSFCSCSSSWMMMVPPPCSMSWAMRSWTAGVISGAAGLSGAWASGKGIIGNAGVCIGRKVMLVVRWWVDIRRWAVLSIEAVVMVVLLVLELVNCLLVRQLSIIGRNKPMATMMVMFVFFMVCMVYCKCNTFGKSVQ